MDLRMARTLPRRSCIRPEEPHCAPAGECCTAASDQPLNAPRGSAALARADQFCASSCARLGGLALVAGHRQPETVVACHRGAMLARYVPSRERAHGTGCFCEPKGVHPPTIPLRASRSLQPPSTSPTRRVCVEEVGTRRRSQKLSLLNTLLFMGNLG
jgi:hypothetical protein